MNKVIVDFDDFAEDNSALDVLFQLKAKIPQFKVTMFAPPMRSSLNFLREVKKLDWIQMAIHGWNHDGQECNVWSKQETIFYLNTALDWGVFVKGFKGPHWSASSGSYEACKQLGVWVADNIERASSGIAMPEDQPIYITNGDMITPRHPATGYERIHGHISWVRGINNDISLLYHYILDKFKDHEYVFIDDVMKELYP